MLIISYHHFCILTKLKNSSSCDVILTYLRHRDVITDGILPKGLSQTNKTALVLCLYLVQNQSYEQKCDFDLCCDPDLDLDPILPKNNRPLGFTLTNIHLKHLGDTLKTVTARGLTNKQTNRQTDKQNNQHTFENRVFESNKGKTRFIML